MEPYITFVIGGQIEEIWSKLLFNKVLKKHFSNILIIILTPDEYPSTILWALILDLVLVWLLIRSVDKWDHVKKCLLYHSDVCRGFTFQSVEWFVLTLSRIGRLERDRQKIYIVLIANDTQGHFLGISVTCAQTFLSISFSEIFLIVSPCIW